jgi:cobaltochelatase CobS
MSKIVCKECGWTGHNLKPHFRDGREPRCSMTLDEYQAAYPEAPIMSELFQAKLEALREKHGDMCLTIKEFDPKAVFGVTMGDFKLTGFVERTRWVPEIDPDYVFPEEATRVILLGLQTNRPTLVHGPTGSGKSTLIEQIAARINYPLIRINHFTDMYASNILGQKVAINGQTLYEYGALPFSMQRPMIYLGDEWDVINPETAFVYQSVLERRHTGTLGSVVLTDNSNEKIDSHPLFRFIATSNTCGLGDDKGHYQGTQLQNLAFISRFQMRIKLDYLPERIEMNILKKRFPALMDKELKAFITVAHKIRELYEKGEINVPYSTRDLINWTEIYMIGGDPQKAMVYTCTSILPFADAKKIEEIIQRTFGK